MFFEDLLACRCCQAPYRQARGWMAFEPMRHLCPRCTTDPWAGRLGACHCGTGSPLHAIRRGRNDRRGLTGRQMLIIQRLWG
jgi:hypothetical protein